MSQSKTNLRLAICFILFVFILQFVAVPFAESVTYTYDDANRLIQEEDGTGTSNEYTYDDEGNLIQKNSDSGGTTYTVTPSAGPNGTISPSTPQTVNYNSTISFTVTPNTGYHIASISGCGGPSVGSQPNNTSYTYITGPITGNWTVTASFSSNTNTYTVTPSAGIGGSISPSTPQTVNYNENISFTVTPNTGYSIASVTGCGGTLAGNTYTTDYITSDCTVTASFAINTYTVTPSAGANGTINPSTPQTVNYNLTTSFTVTPNTGYHIASVSGCGGTLSGNTYTTGPITGHCTVAASFAANTDSLSDRVTLRNKGLSGVTMTLSGAASATTTTDASGNYTFTGLVNGTYTGTPSKTGYTFTPTNSSVTINGASVTGQNFTTK